MQSELSFEHELTKYLENLGETKQWQYLPVHTINGLWQNFREILNHNNQDALGGKELTDTEFKAVKHELVKNCNTPYNAGQFLYGVGRKSQVELDRDNGEHVFLTVFDQQFVGGGNTVYQIANQIEVPRILPGRRNRRFDTTLLINGLPIIQIEEKKRGINVDNALNQMREYVDEKEYSNIFSVLQVLVAMTPDDAVYMAVPQNKQCFDKGLAFHWQEPVVQSKAADFEWQPVYDWREFARQVLSIPAAHNLATNYMILDGTKNAQCLKVMRPYQIDATEKVINKLKDHYFSPGTQKLGYIWHATGSGKTISSFKTAFLASRMSNVDKVVFLVDRVALTNQTKDNYKAYDPNGGENSVVMPSKNRFALKQELRKKGDGIIVTDTQQMDALVREKNFKQNNSHIVFIVDEAHRSTSGEMLMRIRDGFPCSAWVGYTGTPVFNVGQNKKQITTADVFGNPLSIYTLKNSIADHNTLGFNVDFESTLSKQELKQKYLPAFFADIGLTDKQIKDRIANLSDSDLDDTLQRSVFDDNKEHIKRVVDFIYQYWNNYSVNGKYNALLTTHVGGKGSSIKMAMMYYHQFKKENKRLIKRGKKPLLIGITFSYDSRDDDKALGNHIWMREAMHDFNREFKTNYQDGDYKAFNQAVVDRTNRRVGKKHFDITIVVDQLLTGFDAPMLNTLYCDRIMSGLHLIQAFSRTNRLSTDVQNGERDKPFGNIICFRLPAYQKKLMDEALSIYANPQSAMSKGNIVIDVTKHGNDDGVRAPSYKEQAAALKEVVKEMRELTCGFKTIPGDNEKSKQDKLALDYDRYNAKMAAIKQNKEFNDKTKEARNKFIKSIGLTFTEEHNLAYKLIQDLRASIANRKISNVHLQFSMEHVDEVRVNYEYLRDLIAKAVNLRWSIHKKPQPHEKQQEQQEKLQKLLNKIKRYIPSVPSAYKRKQLNDLVDKIKNDKFKSNHEMPIKSTEVEDILQESQKQSEHSEILAFKRKWGIDDIDDPKLFDKLVKKHVLGRNDLDNNGDLRKIVDQGFKHYQSDATDKKVRQLIPVRYNNEFIRAAKEFADKFRKEFK